MHHVAISARTRLLQFAGFYGLCFVVQSIGAWLTQQSVKDWYPALTKSVLTPPGMWFGIVWSILYLLMAIAAMRIYRTTHTVRCRPLIWWLIQLMLGLLWSSVFFGHREITLGLGVIALNWLAIAMTVRLFLRTDRIAGWLLVPLLLWVSFASYLNYFIAANN